MITSTSVATVADVLKELKCRVHRPSLFSLNFMQWSLSAQVMINDGMLVIYSSVLFNSFLNQLAMYLISSYSPFYTICEETIRNFKICYLSFAHD